MDELHTGHMGDELHRAHTKDQTDAPCPMCGGSMAFDPEQGNLLCPYCDHTISLEGEPQELSELDFHHAEHTDNFTWGESQKQVICESCGAQTIYDALETSGTCPYCGSQQVMEEKVDTSLPPNGICAFAVPREEARNRFHKWLKKRIFAPSAAKKSAKAEAFSGLYLPFWTFDADTLSVYSAQYGIERTVRNSKGETRTVTDWHNTRGTHSQFIDDELVLASTRHDRKTVENLEPFDFKEGKPYRPEYLAGFGSERYSVGLEEGWDWGKKQMDGVLQSSITDSIKRQYRADSVRALKIKTEFSKVTYKYLLLPIWMSSFNFRDKNYRFMVNGQTGKVSGKAPVSALRVAIAVLLGLLLMFGIFMLAQHGENGDDYYGMAAQTEAVVLSVETTPTGEMYAFAQESDDLDDDSLRAAVVCLQRRQKHPSAIDGEWEEGFYALRDENQWRAYLAG